MKVFEPVNVLFPVKVLFDARSGTVAVLIATETDPLDPPPVIPVPATTAVIVPVPTDTQLAFPFAAIPVATCPEHCVGVLARAEAVLALPEVFAALLGMSPLRRVGSCA